MNIICFDPGLKGGIAIKYRGEVSAQTMPIAGKTLDLPAIASLIRSHSPDLAVIEKVGSMPGQGVASTFTFGCGYGQLQGLLAGMGIPFELVTPQAWKKLILAGTPKDKDAAIAYCRRAFPDVPLIPPKCRVPHDGIADSLCLLQYGLRQFSQVRSSDPAESSRGQNDALLARAEFDEFADSVCTNDKQVKAEIDSVWKAIVSSFDKPIEDKHSIERYSIGFLRNTSN